LGNSDQRLGSPRRPRRHRRLRCPLVRAHRDPFQKFVAWLGVAASKFYDWRARHGLANEHNALVPRDWWLEDWEKKAILNVHTGHPLEGYRRLAFMMLDANVVAVSPSSVYRVLCDAGLMRRHNCKPSLKGKGFDQPAKPHEHCHVDVTYINIAGTFFYLCSLLDGYSRFLVHWEIRAQMTEADVETILQRARERFPDARPRIISDNGPQFVAKDFKEFVRICGMTHVRTSAYYPQSNGLMERANRTLRESLDGEDLTDLLTAERVIARLVRRYNEERLHSALGYLPPWEFYRGEPSVRFEERRVKLFQARHRRREQNLKLRQGTLPLEGAEAVS
jgi:putative transposase